jgi:hypothetical protein
MNSTWRTAAVATIVAACCASALGQQAEQPVVLVIEMDNTVVYRGDVSDPARLARDSGMPTAMAPRAFQVSHIAGDIVAVNGKPAKGLVYTLFGTVLPRVNPQPGQMIADFDGQGPYLYHWQILGPDGNSIGSLSTSGGVIAPFTFTIIGGSGAFLGAAGESRPLPTSQAARNASVAEDPAKRRINGGSKIQFIFYLYPKYRPSVDISPTGPNVFHADFSPVTATNPTRAGEVLIAAVRNLGPTRPDLLPPGSRPFKADPPEAVNSPVEVTANGKEAEVINKIGWPGTNDLYRVDFRVPAGLAPGMATIQLTAAWIPGPEVKIPVQ